MDADMENWPISMKHRRIRAGEIELQSFPSQTLLWSLLGRARRRQWCSHMRCHTNLLRYPPLLSSQQAIRYIPC
ncbi:hypothetical protein K503DRAFT_778088 [Rhizopogon vinicolor AM-OR11-026]|uniref:Uncharacterized protein n=1 Tax=Rhizopogon vinicolor AM-OR11-026 TaxID=1314800 RepID=A0A1B7MDH3_9AGAM|nr:hypothetical protein K503DRAFT_778088 [Rhizopogon vinicolor AM-OR11-026]